MINFTFRQDSAYQNTDGHDTTHSIQWYIDKQPALRDYITNAVINIGTQQRRHSFPLTSMFGEATGKFKNLEDLPEKQVTKNKFKWKFKLPHDCFRVTTTTINTLDAGRNGETVHLRFKDSYFVKHTTLMNQYNTQLRIMDHPTKSGTEWVYPCQLVTHDKNVSLQARDLQRGVRWIAMWQSASINYSRGYTFNWKDETHEAGFMFGVLRKSKQLSGAAGVYEFELPIDDGSGKKMFKMFIDKSNYDLMMAFQEDWEDYLMYGKRNYDRNGEVFMFDEDNNEPIITSDGILEQITNKETYTNLSPERLSQTIDDLFYSMDSGKKQLLITTGTDGAQWISQALKNKAVALGTGDEMAKRLIGGDDPRGLTLYEGFFNAFVTKHGHKIYIQEADYFDKGKVAQIRDKHPVTGHSLESSRMVMIDISEKDGESNLNIVKKKNRTMVDWNVSGSLSFGGQNVGKERATSIDGASRHLLTEGGIFMYDPTKCLDMQIELC